MLLVDQLKTEISFRINIFRLLYYLLGKDDPVLVQTSLDGRMQISKNGEVIGKYPSYFAIRNATWRSNYLLKRIKTVSQSEESGIVFASEQVSC